MGNSGNSVRLYFSGLQNHCIYASGTTETETTLKAFDLCESADDAEIVFMIGEQTGSITFSDVTLYKRANL